jgi:hypothetical protein
MKKALTISDKCLIFSVGVAGFEFLVLHQQTHSTSQIKQFFVPELLPQVEPQLPQNHSEFRGQFLPIFFFRRCLSHRLFQMLKQVVYLRPGINQQIRLILNIE